MTKLNKISYSKYHEDSDDDLPGFQDFLKYSRNSVAVNRYNVHLDEPIREPKYYRPLIDDMHNATPYDSFRFIINSPGGRGDSMRSIIEAIRTTPGSTSALITGDCHSAASLIALSCDEVTIQPHASMLIHTARYGMGGKEVDVLEHGLFFRERLVELFEDVYEDFLTQDEIDNIIYTGHELWLSAEDVAERLKRREKIREDREKEEASGTTASTPVAPATGFGFAGAGFPQLSTINPEGAEE